MRVPEKQVRYSGDWPFDDSLISRCEGRYKENYDRWSREDNGRARGGLGNAPVIQQAPQDTTGEEAFQRRLAMSSGFQHESLTRSSAPAIDSLETTIGTVVERPVPPMRAETGEEVYLRRLAMSQLGPPPPITSAQLPSNIDEDLYQQPTVPSGQMTPLPPSQTQQGPSEPLDLPERNSITPPLLPSTPSAPSVFNVTADFEERVRNSRNAVAAIAARFSALAPPVEGGDSSEPAPEESKHEPPKRCALYTYLFRRNSNTAKI